MRSLLLLTLAISTTASAQFSRHREIGEGDVLVALIRERGTRGPLPVQRDGKWGYIDRTGALVISPQFDDASFFYEDRAAVRRGDLWGYIEPSGTLVISFQFTVAQRFSDGLAAVRWPQSGGRRDVGGYINPSGAIVLRCDGDDAHVRMTAVQCGRPFVAGYIAEAIETFRCVDEPGNPRTYPCKARFIDRWGFYGKSGRLAIAGPFHSGVSRFAEGLAWAVSYGESKGGFIDSTGTFVVPPAFDQGVPFSEGLAAVRIDASFPRGPASAGPFLDGIALVGSTAVDAVYIDRQGRVIARVGEGR